MKILSKIENRINSALDLITPEELIANNKYKQSIKRNINFIFIWIPKNAGSTIYKHLKNEFGCKKIKNVEKIKKMHPGPYTFGHISVTELIKNGYIDRKIIDNCKYICFVRNPYSRTVSLYNYYKKVKLIPSEMSFKTFLILLRNDFVRPIGLYNSSSLSQANQQYKWVEGINIDFIGRQENLISDLNKLYGLFGSDRQENSVEYLNRSTHDKYMSYYTKYEINIVNDIYEEDFLRFNYEML